MAWNDPDIRNVESVYHSDGVWIEDYDNETGTILVPQRCPAYVDENQNGGSLSEWFPAGYYSFYGTWWQDRISSIKCTCVDPRTDMSVSFNGTSAYAKAPNETWFTGSGFSITAWVKPTATQSFARVIDFGNGPGQANVLLTTSVFATGKPRLGIYKNGVETSVNAPSALAESMDAHRGGLLGRHADGADVQ